VGPAPELEGYLERPCLRERSQWRQPGRDCAKPPDGESDRGSEVGARPASVWARLARSLLPARYISAGGCSAEAASSGPLPHLVQEINDEDLSRRLISSSCGIKPLN
jgi:hypothetical protein